MYPKNSRGALAALLFAGGLWAYKNRDKVQGWVNRQMENHNTSPSPETGNQAYTGSTQRFNESQPFMDENQTTPRGSFTPEI